MTSGDYYSTLLNYAKQLPIANTFAHSAQQELIRSILQAKTRTTEKLSQVLKQWK